MDSSDFIPGLVKMIEERLGKNLGRPITNALLVVVIVAVFLWCFGIVRREAIDPIMSLVTSEYGEDAAGSFRATATRIIGTFTGIILAVWLISKWLEIRFIRKHNAIIEAQKAVIDAYRTLMDGREER